MKRMVLIPEEKLLRYEEQLNDQPPTNEQAGGCIFPISEEAKMKNLCPLR